MGVANVLSTTTIAPTSFAASDNFLIFVILISYLILIIFKNLNEQ